jgi:hypothetical protein
VVICCFERRAVIDAWSRANAAQHRRTPPNFGFQLPKTSLSSAFAAERLVCWADEQIACARTFPQNGAGDGTSF